MIVPKIADVNLPGNQYVLMLCFFSSVLKFPIKNTRIMVKKINLIIKTKYKSLGYQVD